MKIFEWFEDNVAALAVATAIAGFASLGAWIATIFIGAKFFRDEWTYGIPMAFGIPAALLAGVVAFVVIFRKLS
jgi:hypothetical protein